MGSPLAPLMADLFMDKQARDSFASDNFLPKDIQYWFRFEDETLCLRNGTVEKLQELHHLLGNLYPTRSTF